MSTADSCRTQIAVRYFNTEGPVDPAEQYCIDPLAGVNLVEILTLIARKKYFVVHAPRQAGETSVLLALQGRLNSEGGVPLPVCELRGRRGCQGRYARAMRTVLGEIGTGARRVLQDCFVEQSKSALTAEFGPDVCLTECRTRWAELDSRPLALLIDEIDTLVGDTLISVLRQLRAGTTCGRVGSRRASCCAESGTCATIKSIPVGRVRT